MAETPLPLSCAPRRPLTAFLLLLTGFTILAAPAAAQPEGARRPRLAAGPGVEAVAPDGGPAERVAIPPGLLNRLLELPADGETRVADWPVAPGLRAEVVLARHEVYSPEARVFRVDGRRKTELPRSDLAFFTGTAVDDETTRVFVSLDRKGRFLQGFVQSRAGINDLRPVGGVPGEVLVAASEAFAEADGIAPGETPSWTCGEEGLAGPLGNLLNAQAPSSLGSVSADVFSSLHSATVAVDTDNELMLQKFNNDTTAATNYIASLFAAMNVIYERDLNVRLLQGTTFLRVSTTPDPYAQSGTGSADGNKLNEFSNYWAANMGSVPRALAAMLSGKQGQTNSASGIAWINSLCSTGIGYSFSQVFKINYLAGDTLIVAHEIGHNFGSPHSHCYSPPIDNCYNAESGCYSGTKTCPAPTTINGVTNVTGTLMSYCHLSGLANCTSSLVFHPRSVQLFDTILPGKVGVCLPVLGPTAPVVSAIGPTSGTTAGGTPVTITGSNFLTGATVSIGGVPATSVVVASATRITAVTGPHATGAVAVAVTNPGGAAGSLGNSYFYAAPSGSTAYFTVTPCRAVDTRNPNGPLGGPALAAGAQRTFKLTGACGIPASAKAVSANVTAVAPPAGGYLATFPGNAFPLGTSTVNIKAGPTRSSNAMLTLATDGTGTVGVQNASSGSVHLLIDVNGYFE